MTTPAQIGRYVLDGELGRGGMGVVYAAHDPALDRPVALKVIRFESETGLTASPEIEARFLREARLAAKLHHPAVASVFDAGRDGNCLFLVMELVDGPSLARRLQRGAFPSPAEALRLVAQVADALAAAHAVGIVHRDVKPANILLTRGGDVKVSDFGVAKAVGDSTELTHTGSVLGSPAYMAPEQVQGLAVDGRADLFSLGVVLYELLLHRKPFPGDTVTTLIYQILHQDPFADGEAFRALGDGVGGFLRACLAKNPAERIADAATFAARARELAGSVPATLPTEPTVILPTRQAAAAPSTAVVRGGGRRWWPWAAAGAAVVALGWLVVWLATRPPAPPPSLATVTPPSEPGATAPAPPVVPAAATAPATVPPRVPPSPPPAAVASPASAERRPEASTTGAGAPRETAAQPAPTPAPSASPSNAAGEPAAPPATPVFTPPVPVTDTFRCRKAAEFNVSPEESHVLIDGKDIGIADDWDGAGGGKDLDLAAGQYVACFQAAGYKLACVRLVVSPQGDDDVCDVDTELDRDRQVKPRKPA